MPHQIVVELDGPARGRLDAAPYVELIESTLDGEGQGETALTLLLAGDELLWRLNREHRAADEPTDVLSFPGDEGEPMPSPGEATGEAAGEEGAYLGDIAVSVEMAAQQAEEAGLSLEDELRHLVLHGLLHLLGYEHESDEDDAAMRAREEAVLGPEIHVSGGHDLHA
ncbi:MAG: rRNA maturation RNase YbeY [Dehalococcoidia bacterium]|jgi:probable rRNA maturation factor|nr:rRNA maturation RNase YbeY [Dehalococcoidia bacterium]